MKSIVYFAVLELLTNVHKHAGATIASVNIMATPRERVRAVNGRFTITSPTGGPTIARMIIPGTTRT